MSPWERAALWTMVVLGIPCAVALWIEVCLGPVRRWVRRRAEARADAGRRLAAHQRAVRWDRIRRNGPKVKR